MSGSVTSICAGLSIVDVVTRHMANRFVTEKYYQPNHRCIIERWEKEYRNLSQSGRKYRNLAWTCVYRESAMDSEGQEHEGHFVLKESYH